MWIGRGAVEACEVTRRRYRDGMQLRTTAFAKGGEAIAREESGRVVFVAGALPDETVEVELTEERKEFARGRVLSVLDASPDRVAPPCPHVADGCGGCDLQHASPEAQLRLKQGIVTDVLRKIGKFADDAVPPIDVVPLAATGYRTTVRGLVVDGRFAFQRRNSNDAVTIDSCLVLHPLLDELVREARFGNAHAVTLRCGARTDERLAFFEPRVPRGRRLPDDVVVAGMAELRANKKSAVPAYHEVVAGHTFRISAPSFFQVRAGGADALVDTVARACGPIDDATRFVDLYGGVGLFAATVGANAGTLTLVEQNPSSVRDARVNLAGRPARLAVGAVEQWTPDRADVVVADPARSGLGAKGVERVAGTRADRVVLVSCDPAAFARDAALLTKRRYELDSVTIVDLFPQTSHVEVVSSYTLRRPS
jgi:23S rRNA (uracil1939-C5)-methyltransferase